ncbi:MAG TPA: response regulator [Acidimicrobiia bacterium]
MSGQMRALFVDDDSSVLHGLKRMLKGARSEIDAVFVDNGDDAVTMLGLGAYDVVVTDIGMPGTSGLEMLEIDADQAGRGSRDCEPGARHRSEGEASCRRGWK